MHIVILSYCLHQPNLVIHHWLMLCPIHLALTTVMSTRSFFFEASQGRQSNARACIPHGIIRKHWALSHASLWLWCIHHRSQQPCLMLHGFYCESFHKFVTPKTKSCYKRHLRWSYSWNSTNNQGWLHHIAIDDFALVLDLPHAFLSSQHWSQQANYHFLMPHWTIMKQYSHECKLYWGQKTFIKRILLDQKHSTLHFIWHPIPQK